MSNVVERSRGDVMVRAANYILHQFGLPGAGLIFLLEGLGAPIPVEIPLWIIGDRMAKGHATYLEMVLLMWLSTVVGNTIGYLLGYYGGRPAALKLLQWFRVKPETWDRLEGWFQRHGLKIVLATRWTNWGFAQNMWLCGITRVPFGRFFVVMVLNDLLWAMGWTWLARVAMTYFRRHGLKLLHASAVKVGLGAAGVVLVGLGIWALWRWWQLRKAGPK